MEELQARNAQLQAELEKLQALSQLLSNNEAKVAAQHALEDITISRLVYDSLDKDGSGSIDAKQLASWASDVSVALDNAELQAFTKALDSAGSGKITFNAFLRWFSAPGVAGSKLATLQEKLQAKAVAQLKAAAPAQAAVRHAADAADAGDFVRHHIDLDLCTDANQAPRASVRAALNFEKLKAEEAQGEPAIVRLVFSLKPDAVADSKVLEEKKAALEAVLSTAPAPSKLDIDVKNNTLTLTLCAPSDPFAKIVELGIDLQRSVQELSVNLTLPVSPIDVLLESKDKPKDAPATLAEALQARLQVDAVISKSLINSVAFATPAGQDLAFLSLWHATNWVFKLPGLKRVLQSLIMPEDLGRNAPREVAKLAKFARFTLKADSLEKTRSKVADFLSEHLSPPLSTLCVVGRTILDQPQRIQLITQSGVGVTITLHDLISFNVVPENVLN